MSDSQTSELDDHIEAKGDSSTNIENSSSSQSKVRSSKNDGNPLEGLVDEGYDVVKGGREYVSFRPQGIIAPNQNVVDRYLVEYDFAVVLYNEEDNTVAIKPLDRDPNVGKVFEISDTNNLTFSLSGFRHENDIHWNSDKTYRYSIDWDESKEVLKIDLDQDPEDISVQSKSESNSNSA